MRTSLCLRVLSVAMLLLVATAPSWAANSISLGSLSGYGNFHAGGVVLVVSGDDNQNASASLEWRPSGGSFRLGHPLARIDATHFVGSLFWLAPGTSYDARVTLSDPDGVSGPASATVTFQTQPDTLVEPTLRTLYVAPSGNDSNSGTSAAPLRTIQRAADLSQAGDLILIQPGVYRESVSMVRSGTASQPIVFRGNGAGAILDGADATIAAGVSWTAAGGGVYTRVTGFVTDHVVSEAGRLYRYGSLAALQALGAGAPGGFHFDGTQLNVKFADLSSPAVHTMQVARFEDGFVLDGVSQVRIENLELRHYGTGGFGKGVYLRFASDCAVRTSRIHEVEKAGVWVKGGERHRIEDNDLWDTSIFGWPWSLSKGSTAENYGILFTDELGRGSVARRNTIHGSFNGLATDASTAPNPDFSSELDVYENVLYQHTDDAFEPEGSYASNIRFWSNRLQDVHMAFSVAPVQLGPIWAVRNVVYRVGNTRTSQLDGNSSSVLKVNNGFGIPNGPIFLYHNTVFTDAPGSNVITILPPADSPFVRLRNNVLAGTKYVLEELAAAGLDMNGDDAYTTDTTRFVKWFDSIRYDDLPAFQAGTGQELQGLSAAPQLVDPAAGNFAPQPTSPLVDRGLVLPGINDDYQGTAPEIGAIELSVAPLPTLSVSDATVSEGNSGTTTLDFTVSLSAGSSQTVTVDYATANGTAQAGSDYAAASGQLSFSPGSVQRTISVTVNGDTLVEPDETFFVNLGNPANATLADAQGLGTIGNDDTGPVEQPVVWTGAAGVAVSGNDLTKTAPLAWGNAGAVSSQSLVSGDGYVELTVTQTNTARIFGLGNGDSNQNWKDVDFGLYLNFNGRLHVYEQGYYRGVFGAYAPGDKLRVSLLAGVVTYSRNGVVFYTSPSAPTLPMLVDTSLYNPGATLKSVMVVGAGWQ